MRSEALGAAVHPTEGAGAECGRSAVGAGMGICFEFVLNL